MSSSRPRSNGIHGFSEKSSFSLPLKAVDFHFSISGGAALVQIQQIFWQTHTRALDCIYNFPLPAGVAVHRCEIGINGRVIRAVVMEKSDARRFVMTKKAKGYRTALVQMDRENLFTLNLGNTQPGDFIVVSLSYSQALKIQGERLRLRIPLSPGHRYLPAHHDQEDAARVSPPRIASFHPEAALFGLKGEISLADVDLGSVLSPTHSIVAKVQDERVLVGLAMDGEVLDIDFFLEWKRVPATTLQSLAWAYRTEKASYVLARLRAPEMSTQRDPEPRDFYFLVDRSGSMEGIKWTRTCEALRAFVGRLNLEDRVWITLFESDSIDVTKRPVPVSELVRRAAFRRFEELGVAGGTELIPAAQHVFDAMREFSSERRKLLLIITDGQVGNEQEVLDCFKASAVDFSLFTFGIDHAVNDALLENLAREHQGTCTLLTPNDDIVAEVADLTNRLLSPVLNNMKLQGSWEGSETGGFCLYSRQSLVRSLRHDGHPTHLCLKGADSSGSPVELQIPLLETDNKSIELLWLLDHIQRLDKAGRRADAMDLAKEYNLQCCGMSFVAWDASEQVPVSLENFHQPSMIVESVACAGGTTLCYSMPSPGTGRFTRATLESKSPLEAKIDAIELSPEVEAVLMVICQAIEADEAQVPELVSKFLDSIEVNKADLERCFALCREFIGLQLKDAKRDFLLREVGKLELNFMIENER